MLAIAEFVHCKCNVDFYILFCECVCVCVVPEEEVKRGVGFVKINRYRF